MGEQDSTCPLDDCTDHTETDQTGIKPNVPILRSSEPQAPFQLYFHLGLCSFAVIVSVGVDVDAF